MFPLSGHIKWETKEYVTVIQILNSVFLKMTICIILSVLSVWSVFFFLDTCILSQLSSYLVSNYAFGKWTPEQYTVNIINNT